MCVVSERPDAEEVEVLCIDGMKGKDNDVKRTLLTRTADANEYALLSKLLNRPNHSSMFSLLCTYVL